MAEPMVRIQENIVEELCQIFPQHGEETVMRIVSEVTSAIGLQHSGVILQSCIEQMLEIPDPPFAAHRIPINSDGKEFPKCEQLAVVSSLPGSTNGLIGYGDSILPSDVVLCRNVPISSKATAAIFVDPGQKISSVEQFSFTELPRLSQAACMPDTTVFVNDVLSQVVSVIEISPFRLKLSALHVILNTV